MSKAIIAFGFASLVFSGSACLDKSVPTPKSVAISSADSIPTVEKQGGVKPIKKEAPPVVVGLPLFEIYGELAPDGYVDDANPITEKYGFRVKRVAGCEVDSIESTLADRNNKKSLEAMNKKYGKDWRKKFTNETKLELAFPF